MNVPQEDHSPEVHNDCSTTTLPVLSVSKQVNGTTAANSNSKKQEKQNKNTKNQKQNKNSTSSSNTEQQNNTEDENVPDPLKPSKPTSK